MLYFEAKGDPLKYEKFKKYYIERNNPGQWVFKFENNYGASVVKHFGSYGYEDNLFELAVIYFEDDEKFHISYDTPITDDVIGFLNNEDVMKLLEKIKNLEG